MANDSSFPEKLFNSKDKLGPCDKCLIQWTKNKAADLGKETLKIEMTPKCFRLLLSLIFQEAILKISLSQL